MRLDSYASTADGTVTTGWTGTRVVRSTTQKHSGTYAWQITAVTDASDKTKYAVTIPNGSSWHWSGWLYQATGTPQDVWLNTGNASGVDSVFTVTVPSAVWTYFSFDLVITDGDKVNLFIQPADTFTMGTMYFDDLSFTSWNMESSFGAYTWGASALVSGPRGEPIDETQRFSVAQMTSDGPGAVWNNCTSVNTKFRTGGTSWAITADASGMFNAWTDPLNLPETNWVYSGWLYQETGQDRDVQTVVDTADGLSWYDTFTIPSGVWTEFISSGHTDVTYVNLYASGVWSPGDDLYFDDMSFVTTSGYKDLEVTWKARSDLLPAPVNTTISTSTGATATAYSNQRAIDRTSNGVLWAIWWNGTGSTSGGLPLWYSLDDGVTWNNPNTPVAFAGTGSTYTPNASLFIDIDDYAHVVYKDRHDGYVYYRRGTPNASRTSWAWSLAINMVNYSGGPTTSPVLDYPDVVAHREGSGWAAHVVQSRADYTAWDYTYYTKITIASGGVTSRLAATIIGGAYANTVSKYPSIDFNHTGDGKTVKDGTPHLYVAWSAGTTGSGKGIRFKKATYSAGSWTWGAEREIDPARYVSSAAYGLLCMFDGTRIVIAGPLLLDDSVNVDTILYERDVSDTTTTTKVLQSDILTGAYLRYGSATYDAIGNVYLFGSDGRGSTNTTDGLVYRKWDRASGTFEPEIDIEVNSTQFPYFSAKRGSSNNKIEFVYTNGASSPYSVKYGSFYVPPAKGTEPKEFGFTGNAQTYVVPLGITKLQVECWGARSSGSSGAAYAALGGYAKGTLEVTSGEEISILCGGMDGFNGGGINTGSVTGAAYMNGGGASDVRRGGIGLPNRVIVAGGGGGASRSSAVRGGDGGGLSGNQGTNSGGAGGSQTSGFQLGIGQSSSGSGGCGGGGYYGGFSNTATSSGGGGGSGYIGGVTDGVMQTGVNSGDGKVVITPIIEPSPYFVWDGTDKLPADLLGIWDGTGFIPAGFKEVWSPYTENYEGVY